MSRERPPLLRQWSDAVDELNNALDDLERLMADRGHDPESGIPLIASTGDTELVNAAERVKTAQENANAAAERWFASQR